MTHSIPLKVAVVGCGYWGPNLVRNFQSLPDCRVEQVCDLDPERLRHMRQLYPDLRTTTDFPTILENQESVRWPSRPRYEAISRWLGSVLNKASTS